jgi:hypothetical protein
VAHPVPSVLQAASYNQSAWFQVWHKQTAVNILTSGHGLSVEGSPLYRQAPNCHRSDGSTQFCKAIS